MKAKKFLILFLLLNLIFTINFVYATEIEEDIDLSVEAFIDTYAPCALLMEKETGAILYEKDAYSIRFPASTVKIMTAIIALENSNLTDLVTVNESAISAVPSSYTVSNILPNEVLTLEDLLYAMLVPSGNDAAFAIAEYIGGDITNFSNMMNQKAIEIGGCQNTVFTNPNGIHDENMHTTAYDLALIASYAMNNETFRNIVSTPTYTLPSTNVYPSDDRVLKNSNHLIDTTSSDYYNLATGVKTGFTNAAQNCLVASAKNDNVEFIVVILGATESNFSEHSKFFDAKNLLEYGFSNYFDYYHDYIIKLEDERNSPTNILSSIIDSSLIVDEQEKPRWGYVLYLIAKFTLILIAILYLTYAFVLKVKRYNYNRTHAKFKYRD